MCIADFWTQRERARVGWFGRMSLKHVYYHVRNESPVYVRCRIQHAWGWCMGMIQRDDMGWEVGGGFRIGSLYTPVVESCQCTAKPIQYCKVKLSKNKIEKKKKRDMGLIPRSGRSPGEGHGNPPQYSCLENPMDRGAWWAMVHRQGHKELGTTERT